MQSFVVMVLSVCGAPFVVEARQVEMVAHYWFPSDKDDQMCKGGPDITKEFQSDVCVEEAAGVTQLMADRRSFAVKAYRDGFMELEEGEDPTTFIQLFFGSDDCGGDGVDLNHENISSWYKDGMPRLSQKMNVTSFEGGTLDVNMCARSQDPLFDYKIALKTLPTTPTTQRTNGPANSANSMAQLTPVVGC